MSKRTRPVCNSFITDIDLNALLTFVRLCGPNVMSHFSESAVLMKTNLTQRNGVDITFSLFIMTKIELSRENKLWILLSPMTTTGSKSEKLFLPFCPIGRLHARDQTSSKCAFEKSG